MNQKITVKTQRGDICYCVIDPGKNTVQQLAQVQGREIGHGITYEMTQTQIQMVDYYHAEVIASHDILSVEETTEAVNLQWTTVSGKE